MKKIGTKRIPLGRLFLMAFGFVIVAGCAQKPDYSSSSQAPTSAKMLATGDVNSIVSSHADAKSCWSVISGNVYDLTTYINQHPGGDRAILAACGKDATAMFDAKHGMDPQKWEALQQFKVMVK